MDFVISCNSWVESLLKKELLDLDIQVDKVDDRLVFFSWDESVIPEVNLWSRIWNKVYLIIAKSKVESFDDLFEFVYAQDWQFFVNKGQPVTVLANSIKSKLSSIPTIQAIWKKSIVKKLLNGRDGLLEEDKRKDVIEITLTINEDECYILLNTSWTWLHHRGYKKHSYEAPIKENLAASIVKLSWWKFGQDFHDFFCGSGSVAIEAALIAKNIAPWLYREFDFQSFKWLNQSLYTNAVYLAKEKIKNKKIKIFWSDINPVAIHVAKQNAKEAWLDWEISFEIKDFYKQDPKNFSNICFVSNPPYGLRLKFEDLNELHTKIADFYENSKKISWWIITGYEDYINIINKKHWEFRKLFNGWEKVYFYKFNR